MNRGPDRSCGLWRSWEFSVLRGLGPVRSRFFSSLETGLPSTKSRAAQLRQNFVLVSNWYPSRNGSNGNLAASPFQGLSINGQVSDSDNHGSGFSQVWSAKSGKTVNGTRPSRTSATLVTNLTFRSRPNWTEQDQFEGRFEGT